MNKQKLKKKVNKQKAAVFASFIGISTQKIKINKTRAGERVYCIVCPDIKLLVMLAD